MDTILNEQQLRERLPISTNLDLHYINGQIEYVESILVAECLGAAFYDELLNQYITATLTPANSTLVNTYLLDLLASWCFYHMYPFIQNRAENKALVINYDSSSNAVDSGQLKFVRSEIRIQAQTKQQRMMKFLAQHINDYPTFANTQTSTCGCQSTCSRVYPLNI